ncbi:unnamed protein product [Orchesella dallaii]|uniref:Chitin-binding type-2 domain-containing protein n=1 Tax=Orchesella dallaii TaxID=48710 RepID=A0ABP1PXC3_9HEXA
MQYGPKTSAFLSIIYLNILFPFFLYSIICYPFPTHDPNDSNQTIIDPPTRTNESDSSKSNKTVFVGDVCGQNMFWDPSINVCIPKPKVGKGGGNNTTPTTTKSARKRLPFHSEEEVTDPPDNTVDHTPASPPRKELESEEDENSIRVEADPHCGLGYKWSTDDMMCAKYED